MEIVFSRYFIDPTEPFYVSYYNMERNTVIKELKFKEWKLVRIMKSTPI